MRHHVSSINAGHYKSPAFTVPKAARSKSKIKLQENTLLFYCRLFYCRDPHNCNKTAIKQVGRSGLYANELSKMHRCSGEMNSHGFAETNLYDIEVIKA